MALVKYKGWKFECRDEESEVGIKAFIDQFGNGNMIPDGHGLGKGETAKYFQGVQTLYIPENIKYIGNYSFAQLEDLEMVVAPGVEEVGEHAFYCDMAMHTADFKSAKVLHSDSFNGADLSGRTYFPKVEEVGSHAFWWSNLKSFEAKKLTWVDTFAFKDCHELEDFIAPILSLEGAVAAFLNCDKLKKVNVGSYDKNAFCPEPDWRLYITNPGCVVKGHGDRCKKHEAECEKDYQELMDSEKLILSEKDKNRRPYIGAANGFVFECDTQEAMKRMYEFADTMGNGKTTLSAPEGMFDDVSVLLVPNWVTSVDDGCFKKAKGLLRVVLPGVKEIGEMAFYGCRDLEDVTADECVELKQDAFNGCGIKGVWLPKVQKVGNYAFWECFRLKELDLPALKEIGEQGTDVISKCRELETVRIKSARRVGSSAISNNPKLKRIEAEGAKNFDAIAVANCRSLETLSLSRNTIRKLKEKELFNVSMKIWSPEFDVDKMFKGVEKI